MNDEEVRVNTHKIIFVWLASASIGCLIFLILLSTPVQAAGIPKEGSILPFPPTPSASVAGPTVQTSKHQRRVEKNRLPKDAPNILIVLIDDVGFAQTDTFDVGVDLGSPVSLDYFDRRPFRFTGKIKEVKVELK